MKRKLVSIITVILIMIMLVACGRSSSDSYRETLESGQRKAINGEKMSQQEYNAVKDFNEWKEKNSEKTYEDWDK